MVNPVPQYGPDRSMLNQFLDDLITAEMRGQIDGDGLPWVEAPREVIQYYNRGKMLKGFDDVGYFVMQNTRVYEVGKREVASEKYDKQAEKTVKY